MRKLLFGSHLSNSSTCLSVSSVYFLRKLLDDVVHQGEGVTQTAKSKEEEIPGRRASRSRGNFQGDGEGKSKGKFMAPATGTKFSQNQGAGPRKESPGNKNEIN